MRYVYKATFHQTPIPRWTWAVYPIARPDFSPARKHGESQKQYRSRQKQMKLYNKAMRNGNRLLMLPA